VEVKAPWVVLCKGDEGPICSAENRFKGSVVRVIKGKINSEDVVQISETTELCSTLTEKIGNHLKSKKAMRSGLFLMPQWQ
jgi:molybdopterin-binding protein